MDGVDLIIRATLATKVTFASHQNSVPVLRELKIENLGEQPLSDLTIEIEADPPILLSRRWPLDRIMEHSTVEVRDIDVSLNAGLMLELHEAMTATITVRVIQGDSELASQSYPLEALAQTEWGGSGMPELLAAFVMPNDPAVEMLLKEAARVLSQAGKSDSLNGYLSGSATRVWEVASAIWSALMARGLTYALPAASFETEGQKIRTPSAMLSGGLATCLDTACFFAAALEQAGLNPIIVLTKGHAFPGVWLQPEPFSEILTDEAATLRKRIALRELVVFETTLATQHPAVAFSVGVDFANRQISEDREGDFVLALDLRRARMQRLRPLALRLQTDPTTAAPENVAVLEGLEEAPALPSFAPRISAPEAETGDERLRQWRRKLLDLTLRNRLLNTTPGKTFLRLLCPDPAALEDRLAGGSAIRIVCTPALDAGGRDADLHAQRTGEQLVEVYAKDALARDEVMSPLNEKDLQSALIELYRKARLDLQEGGANTLFLAVGFLSWKREPEDVKSYRAPLILLPVTLERKTARSDVRMKAHEDKARFNGTLLEMLRQDFELSQLDDLERDLPLDDSGVDVESILAQVRLAVRDMRGFEVIDEVMIGTFSFSKYLMWKDLTDRSAQLRENRVVRHLLETPREPFPASAEIPRPETLDSIVSPGDLYTPLPADSSQLAAVVASARECDFVLDGPPGTGKSQTIANIIAHNLALGRKVLFVAEKMVALNVVYRRLAEHKLDAFCLELHSSKANKADVVRQLGRAWDTLDQLSAETWAQDSDKLKALRTDLNEIVRLLHQPQLGGMSLHHAIGLVVRDGGPQTPVFTWPPDRTPDTVKLARMRDVARRLGLNRSNTAELDRTAFGWIGADDWSPAWQTSALAAAAVLAETVRDLSAALAQISEFTKIAGRADPAGLSAMLALADALADADGANLRFAFEPDHLSIAGATRSALANLGAYRTEEATLSAKYARAACRAIPVEVLTGRWAAAKRRFWPFSFLARMAVRKALATSGGCESKPNPEQDLPILARMSTELSALDGLAAALTRVDGWAGLETQREAVNASLSKAAALSAAVAALAQSPDDVIGIKRATRDLVVDANELLSVGMPLRQAIDRYRRTHDAHQTSLQQFRTLARTPEQLELDQTLPALGNALERLSVSRTSLNAWCGWMRARTDALDLDLLPLIAAVEGDALSDAGAEGSFEVGYARWLADAVMDAEPVLRRFLSSEHDAKIKDFRKLDETLSELAAQAIRAKLSSQIPRKDDKRLPHGYGALRHQLSLRAPRKALRELAAEMGETLTTLTPCLLMSPLSVAQYLPANTALFDLVIFDEASQIAPWDAIGAIARGRQVIVAGDPKQMPPTNYFNRGPTSGDDVESEEVEDQESVLEQCLSANLPQLRLTWHYRSRHESLITFSNHRYYDGELTTFPAAVTRQSMVSFVKVEGVYARGRGRTNPTEAKTIVVEIMRRLRDPLFVDEKGARLSIGVITFNSEQQRLIEDLLDKERQAAPSIERFFDESLSEPVAVKNLETSQGDERDLILLGVGFGPDTPEAKDMSMNFGPLNKDGGWRRWNVAITRARREVILFASFTPGMVDINRSKARAVKDLRDYQDFAIRGPIALAQADHGSVGGYESAFEQAVARGLRDKGWQVTTQIGVSRFRIDLGVVHPDQPGAFLVGIECDGAAYHSAATARDRDKVREGILRNLGWDLLRVWSTDWWLDRAAALDILDKKLCERLAASREAARAQGATDSPAPLEALLGSGDAPVEAELRAEKIARSSAPMAQPLTSSLSTQTGAKYRCADLSKFRGVLRPELFYDSGYDPILVELTAHVVRIEAPIRDDLFVDRIARAHGFARSGRLIRERILKLKGRQFMRWKDPAGGLFVWPDAATRDQWSAFRVPATEDDVRSIDDICTEELCAGAIAIESTDLAWELSRQLGIRRLSAPARERITRALATIVADSQSNDAGDDHT